MLQNYFTALIEPPFYRARVITQDRGSYLVEMLDLPGTSTYRASISGALRFDALIPVDLPMVGDFVIVKSTTGSDASITQIKPRQNVFARRAVDGSRDLQPIAANLDTLFIAASANKDFNPRRLERYIAAAQSCDISCAVVLTKCDLVDDFSEFVTAVKALSRQVELVAVSARNNIGLHELAPFCGPDKTIAFVGSSGVGKSTLINSLLGSAIMHVSHIAHDQRGRHTTTRRMLLKGSDGTAIIDTPGMREFALADAGAGVDLLFSEMLERASRCKFSDCRHTSEPGCAVVECMDPDAIASYRKLAREAAYQARKHDSDTTAAAEQKAKWKAIHKANRQTKKDRY